MYEERDVEALLIEDLYMEHVEAMTDEGLHSKAAIAAELAWRDHLLQWSDSVGEALKQDCIKLQAELKAFQEATGYDTAEEYLNP